MFLRAVSAVVLALVLLPGLVSRLTVSAVTPGPAMAAAQPIRSLAGELLVATPEMRDPRFARTVIYMAQHGATGAQGLVINRPLGEIALAKLLEQMRMPSAGVTGTIRLHAGGPVETLRVYVLHTSDYSSEGTVALKDGISVTFEPDILQAIAAGKGPRRALFALGYAGWAPGQLEAEIQAGAWIRAAADEGLLFDDDYDQKWDKAQARRKIDL